MCLIGRRVSFLFVTSSGPLANSSLQGTTIDAPNTSHCEWSSCGRFLLTAFLSPRLRVDNGIKTWHCIGMLQHLQAIEEPYQESWQPTPISSAPPFGKGLSQVPAPAKSVRRNHKSLRPPECIGLLGLGVLPPLLFLRWRMTVALVRF
ncbi:hypothetical protein BDQ17DRAFT_1256896 [Cyathus striatus]|nr:hypothetical protein BDQ17DRAFT_1256896 [Cyathus striatus]